MYYRRLSKNREDSAEARIDNDDCGGINMKDLAIVEPGDIDMEFNSQPQMEKNPSFNVSM
jgi:hypothetical protein